MSDIRHLQHDEADLRKALTTHDVAGTAEAQEHLRKDFSSYTTSDGALAAYDKLVVADAAKHLQPLILFDATNNELDTRPDVSRQIDDLWSNNRDAFGAAALNARWSENGKGSIADNASKDAAKMLQSPQDLASFEQHMRDASVAPGNQGESYANAVNAELAKDGAAFRVDLRMQSTAVNPQPGEYGNFKLNKVGQDDGQFINF
jgi:hypothetical protein